MENTPWTNYHYLPRQNNSPQLKRKDRPGSFSIGALTLMDTQTTPSCLKIRILCRHATIPSLFCLTQKVVGETIGFMAAVGYHLARSPCLCLYFVSWCWWSLRGWGIISDSCQPSALFGIMFLLGVIPRLQKSCCLYSEKQRGNWRWVAGYTPTDLKRKNKVPVTLAWTHMFAENRELAITNKGRDLITLVIKVICHTWQITSLFYNDADRLQFILTSYCVMRTDAEARVEQRQTLL